MGLRRILIWAACLAPLLSPLLSPLWGQRPATLPKFTGAKVILEVGLQGDYGVVEEAIQTIEKTSQQTYWVVVVRNAGPGAWGASDYANNLAKQWTNKIDTERSVIVVLGVDGRNLAIHGGTVLQDRFGLQGQRIDREIVQPHFIPLARQLNYPAALATLLPGIEQWIVRREQTWRVEREQSKRRSQRVKLEAVHHLETTQDLIDDLRRDLNRYPDFSAASAAGLVGLADQSEQQLIELAKQLKADGREESVLERTLVLESKIASARKTIGSLVAAQSDSGAKLENLERELLIEEQALETLGRSGVRTGSASILVDDVDVAINETRRLITREPLKALRYALQGEEALVILREHRMALKDIGAVIDSEAAGLKPKIAAYKELVARQQEAGLETRGASHRLENLQALVDTRLDDATADQQRLRRYHEDVDHAIAEAEAALRRHHTRTRTVPLALGGLALLGLCGTGLGLHVRSRKWKRKATERYEPYNREIIDLLDKLDDFQRRHELLPFSDPDFKEPITGDTLDLYEQLETRQEDLRQEWVDMMDRRAMAEDLVEAKSPFSPDPYRQAINLIEKDEHKPRAEAAYADCIGDLEALEGSHEAAEALLETCRQKKSRVDTQLEKIAATSFSVAPYEPLRRSTEAALKDAGTDYLGDPLGTTEHLKKTSSELSEFGRWTETILNHAEGAKELRGKLDKARKHIDKRRAEGLSLVEEEGNPDPIWEQGDAEQREALTALDGGDHITAEQHLHSGFGCWEEALDRVRRQQDARSFCQRELPGLKRELDRLQTLRQRTRDDQTHLEKSYDPGAWSDVVGNFDMASRSLEQLAPLVSESETSAAKDQQLYFHAADLILQGQHRLAQTDAMLTAITNQRQEIDALVPSCQADILGVSSELDKVGAIIRKHHRIVSRDSVDDLHALRALLEDVETGAKAARPHWPRMATQLKQIDETADALRSQVRQEVAAHDTFREAMKTSEHRMDGVARLLRSSKADRALANRVYKEAAAVFESTQRAARENHADWLRLLAGVKDIDEALKRSEVLARDDIRLAQQVESTLRRAQSDINRARSFHREGVRADLDDARARLDRAKRHARDKNYEKAIEGGVNTSRSAADALATAESHARRIRRRREDRHRRRDLERRRRQTRRSGLIPTEEPGAHLDLGGFRRSSKGTGEKGQTSWGSGASQSSW